MKLRERLAAVLLSSLATGLVAPMSRADAATTLDLQTHGRMQVTDLYAGPDGGLVTVDLLVSDGAEEWLVCGSRTWTLTSDEMASLAAALDGAPTDALGEAFRDVLYVDTGGSFVSTYRDTDGIQHTITTTPKKKEKLKSVIQRHVNQVNAIKEAFPPAPAGHPGGGDEG